MLKRVLKQIVKKTNIDYVFTRFLQPFYHEISVMSVENASVILQECSPKPEGRLTAENTVADELIDLQIIVPSYNAEKYLQECLESALSQETKYSYKVVVVDDGSTDNTKAIIKKYAHDKRIVPIFQDNLGSSGARNSGLKEIFARYIMFLDSDDILTKHAVESLLDVAYEVDADIVEGSAYLLKDNDCIVYDKYKKRNDNYLGRLKGQPWGKVYKSYIFDRLCFPDGFWHQDSINALFIYPQVHKVSVIPEFVYIYRRNSEGITATASKHNKAIDTYWITELLVQSYVEIGGIVDKEYMETLIRQAILNYKRTSRLNSEIQEAIFILTSDLFKSCGTEQYVPKIYSGLYNAFVRKDFGAYKVWASNLIL